MNTSRIAELLKSYIVGLELPSGIYEQLSVYLDLLLRWNAKTNLTAIRDPEQIVTRHFGESLFAAGVLFGSQTAITDNRQLTTDNSLALGSGAPLIPAVGMSGMRQARPSEMTLADLGSGAGFPGIPIKLAVLGLNVTLIESQNKKATFLKEVIRTLRLDGIDVYSGRAEHWGKQAGVVTMRAVEKLEAALPVAASLVAPGGALCLLAGGSFDLSTVRTGNLDWQTEAQVPGSHSRKLIIARPV